MKEILKEYFLARKKLKIAKNRYKAFCKISKICRKNKLELTRTSDYVLIIRGFFEESEKSDNS